MDGVAVVVSDARVGARGEKEVNTGDGLTDDGHVQSSPTVDLQQDVDEMRQN